MPLNFHPAAIRASAAGTEEEVQKILDSEGLLSKCESCPVR